MIYNRNAVFSYPVLNNESSSYINNRFYFDVNLKDDSHNFIFEIEYVIENKFILDLLNNRMAVMIFIIQSKDNYFKVLDRQQNKIIIPKNRISLSETTMIQLHIQSLERFSFNNCDELEPFYDEHKNKITIDKYMLLGYSNIVRYQGSKNKPLVLFEKKINPEQNNPFKVELSYESIVLCFQNEELLMRSITQDKNILNLYVYMGLYRALVRFYEENDNGEEYLIIDTINQNQSSVLNQKLLDLMINKGIEEINPDDIDDVIINISNKLIEKFVNSIEGVANYGN